MTTPTRDLVLSHLRREKVQLWKQPYHQIDADTTSTSDALRTLAQGLAEQLSTTSEAPLKVDDILSILIQLQSHALKKLESHSVNIKILATPQHFANLSDVDGMFASWGDTVTIVKSDSTKKKSLLIRVGNISSALTIDKLSSELCCALNATTSRVIFKGKHLSGQGSLRKIVSSQDGKEEQKKNELLCIVSGHGYVPSAPPVAAAAGASSVEESTTDTTRTDKEIISSIRSSASLIAYNQSGFEITDQNGNLVPMSQTDSISLLTALGLHRIGRSKMEKSKESDEDDGDKRNSMASALVFLLEADAEWQGSSTLGIWKNKVDNYGLLQLDIAWTYLLLGSLENLSDASRRLEIAETVLRKQVHSNFVTLALVNAEANNPIPPLCSIFVRLFLLQGVANKMRNCNDTATERLGWARVLCQQLRASCPPDRVEILCGAYCVDPSTAISALRKFNGDPNAAGNFIANLRDEESRSAKKRKRQHKLGKCANNSDFVNLELVPTLSDLLGFRCVTNNIDDGQDDQSTSNMICSGLLRLSNNDMEQSLALYNEIGAQGVLQRVVQLDKDLGITRATSNKKVFEVSDVDVASLVSMGVEEERGRNALRATGSVDSALLLLMKDNDDASGALDQTTENDNVLNGDPINSGQEVKRTSSDESKEDSVGSSDNVEDAYDFLQRELGYALSNDSKEMLEKEWLGVDLKEEWGLIEEYN